MITGNHQKGCKSGVATYGCHLFREMASIVSNKPGQANSDSSNKMRFRNRITRSQKKAPRRQGAFEHIKRAKTLKLNLRFYIQSRTIHCAG